MQDNFLLMENEAELIRASIPIALPPESGSTIGLELKIRIQHQSRLRHSGSQRKPESSSSAFCTSYTFLRSRMRSEPSADAASVTAG
jgi:hypothetical protein